MVDFPFDLLPLRLLSALCPAEAEPAVPLATAAAAPVQLTVALVAVVFPSSACDLLEAGAGAGGGGNEDAPPHAPICDERASAERGDEPSAGNRPMLDVTEEYDENWERDVTLI